MNSNLTETKVVQKFGIIVFIFFGSLCGLGFWLKKPVPIFLFGTLAILGLGFIFMPAVLMPVYNAWLKIARFIGIVITTISLTLAYYIGITPLAIIKRFFSGRPIPVKPDKKTSSYWVSRSEPSQPKERFIKRF